MRLKERDITRTVRDEKIKQHPAWLRLLAIMNGGAA